MECALIFYTACKTGYCETALDKRLNQEGLMIADIAVALSAVELGEAVNTFLNAYQTLFIIGDTERKDDKGLLQVLSLGLSGRSVLPKVEKIICKGVKTGYLLTILEKQIVILPDNPLAIEKLLQAELTQYLSMVTK